MIYWVMLFLIVQLVIFLSGSLVLVCLILRLYGFHLTIHSIYPTSFEYARYSGFKLYQVVVSSFRLAPHLPKPSQPYWAKFIVRNYEYHDSKCAVSISRIEGTLWFFPMLFRFTSGPLLTLKFDDFRVQIYNSATAPWWVCESRDNLIYTAINEETVRLHQFKQRFALCGLAGLAGGAQGLDGPAEKPGLGPEQELDEVKIQGKAQQWHIHNVLNNRMYTFNLVEAELRESEIEDRKSLVVIAHDSKWTKLPVVGHCLDLSLSQYLIRALCQSPKELLKMMKDPLSVINIDVSRCDITFGKFHLIDSALFDQGGVLVRRKYSEIKDHGMFNDACIDSTVHALMSLYEDQKD